MSIQFFERDTKILEKLRKNHTHHRDFSPFFSEETLITEILSKEKIVTSNVCFALHAYRNKLRKSKTFAITTKYQKKRRFKK